MVKHERRLEWLNQSHFDCLDRGELSKSSLVKIEALNEHRANKRITFQSINNEIPILTMLL